MSRTSHASVSTRSIVLAGWLGPAVAALLAAVGVAAQAPRLDVRSAGTSLFVSFDLQSTRTDDLVARVRSAEPVSVTWAIDVRREVPMWFDHDIRRFALEVTARPTSAPDVFTIERSLNGRTLGTPTMASLDEVYRALTAFEDVELRYAARRSTDGSYRLALSATVMGGGEARIVTQELARAVIER